MYCIREHSGYCFKENTPSSVYEFLLPYPLCTVSSFILSLAVFWWKIDAIQSSKTQTSSQIIHSYMLGQIKAYCSGGLKKK